MSNRAAVKEIVYTRRRPRPRKRQPQYRWLQSRCDCAETHAAGQFFPDYYVAPYRRSRKAPAVCTCEECRAYLVYIDEQRLRRWEEGGKRPQPTLREQIDRLEILGAEIPAEKLPSEEEADLLLEIARWRDVGKVVILYADGSAQDVPDPPPPEPPAH